MSQNTNQTYKFISMHASLSLFLFSAAALVAVKDWEGNIALPTRDGQKQRRVEMDVAGIIGRTKEYF